MSNKHTPGPWHFHQNGDANDFTFLADETRWVMRLIFNGELYLDEEIATAKLIAAAPDMLKALQGVISHNNGLKEQYQISPSLIDQVEQAIKKATDETI
jgi:hypothetical protein